MLHFEDLCQEPAGFLSFLIMFVSKVTLKFSAGSQPRWGVKSKRKDFSGDEDAAELGTTLWYHTISPNSAESPRALSRQFYRMRRRLRLCEDDHHHLVFLLQPNLVLSIWMSCPVPDFIRMLIHVPPIFLLPTISPVSAQIYDLPALLWLDVIPVFLLLRYW